MTKTEEILAVLADGPALTGEVAVELGWTVHRTSALLRYLWCTGKIRRTVHPMRTAHVRYLWTGAMA